jgi:hypothetical protein
MRDIGIVGTWPTTARSFMRATGHVSAMSSGTPRIGAARFRSAPLAPLGDQVLGRDVGGSVGRAAEP